MPIKLKIELDASKAEKDLEAFNAKVKSLRKLETNAETVSQTGEISVASTDEQNISNKIQTLSKKKTITGKTKTNSPSLPGNSPPGKMESRGNQKKNRRISPSSAAGWKSKNRNRKQRSSEECNNIPDNRETREQPPDQRNNKRQFNGSYENRSDGC